MYISSNIITMFSEELMRFVSGSSCKDISFWGTWDVPWLIDEIFEASSKVSLEVADFLKELQMITRVYSHVNLKLSSKPQIHSLHWNDFFFVHWFCLSLFMFCLGHYESILERCSWALYSSYPGGGEECLTRLAAKRCMCAGLPRDEATHVSYSHENPSRFRAWANQDGWAGAGGSFWGNDQKLVLPAYWCPLQWLVQGKLL